MNEPLSPVLAPFYTELGRDQAVLWCACGRSRRQPYCDGSHVGTGIRPIRHVAERAEEVLLCGCKRTGTPPFCDGSHNALIGVYGTDDADSAANRAIPTVGFAADGKARIDGGCFVGRVDQCRWQERDGIRWAALVTRADAAIHQALFCFDIRPSGADVGSVPTSPIIAFGDCQVALLFPAADAQLTIGDRRFDIRAAPGTEVGACVLPGETFRIDVRGPAPIRVHAAVGPGVDAPLWPMVMNARFDGDHPERVAPVDPAQRHAMAERYFQVLVSSLHGARGLTQFIGEIPRSKATPHRHLYEETLIILAGRGTMWTQSMKAPVEAGDIIFLPRKQIHSLQCVGPDPMQLVGVIHPGDNPSINYY